MKGKLEMAERGGQHKQERRGRGNEVGDKNSLNAFVQPNEQDNVACKVNNHIEKFKQNKRQRLFFCSKDEKRHEHQRVEKKNAGAQRDHFGQVDGKRVDIQAKEPHGDWQPKYKNGGRKN